MDYVNEENSHDLLHNAQIVEDVIQLDKVIRLVDIRAINMTSLCLPVWKKVLPTFRGIRVETSTFFSKIFFSGVNAFYTKLGGIFH